MSLGFEEAHIWVKSYISSAFNIFAYRNFYIS